MPKLTIDDLKKIKEKSLSMTSVRGGANRAKVTIHMGTCGIASGARKVMNALAEAISERNISDVLITTSGCAGLCSREPMATVEVQDQAPVKYVELDEKKIIRILDDHVLGGKIVAEYALGRGSETGSP